MTHEEAKKAWYEKKPVVSGGIKYLKINALIYRLDKKNNIEISAELLDQNTNSVVIARFEDVGVYDDK